MAGKTREETPEHVERDVAISYLSRLAVLQGLSPRLGSARADGAPRPRVFVMGSPGYGVHGDADDLNSEESYKPMVAHANKSGKVRKIALMRVEHNGEYALVGSKGGAPEHPVWVYNLKANPDEVTIQDGPEPFEARARQVAGEERAAWWERAVAAFPPYAQYQQKTDREIPVFVASPKV